MAQTYANNASSTLASGYTAGDSTITLAGGGGAAFPATGDFMLAMANPVLFYLKCTSRSTDVLTVTTSGQEGTSASNLSTGAAVNQVITAGSLTAIIQENSTGTVTHTGGALTANLPVIGAGSGDIAVGTRSGNTTEFATVTGSVTSTHVATWDASGNLQDGGAPGATPALVLLEQHTASSSAALNFTTAITSTYDDYKIDLINILPATDNVILRLQVSTDGGSTYDTGNNYKWAQWVVNQSGGTGANASVGAGVQMGDTIANLAANGGLSGTIEMFAPGQAATNFVKFNTRSAWCVSTTFSFITGSGGCVYNVATAVNAFRIIFSSGNIATGIVRCYGIAK